jgi:intracellular sulfur oxidation DsrE/DsrF family protein
MKKLFIVLLLLITSTFAAQKFSDPQPTFDNPRKWVINLSTNDVETVNHILSSINNVLKEYPDGAMNVAVVAYSSGMRVLKKDYDPKTLIRIKSLMEYDVEFIGCKNTMETMHWAEKDFIEGLDYVQAGIAEALERIVAGWIPMTAY